MAADACGDEKLVARRLLTARTTLLQTSGFYGILLMHMGFALADDHTTAWTDGDTIYFNPKFALGLTERELRFVLQHEVLHAALQHPLRGSRMPDHRRANVAADIVVNSNILACAGGDLSAIELKGYGVSMHTVPDGSEGYHYSFEQVYKMLQDQEEDAGGAGCGGRAGGDGGDDGDAQDVDREGEPRGGKACKGSDAGGDGGEAQDGPGFDTLVEPADDKNDGDGGNGAGGASGGLGIGGSGAWFKQAQWEQHIRAAVLAAQAHEGSGSCAGVPPSVVRAIEELANPRADWRRLLDEFVQEEVVDYSFSRPDARFSDVDVIMPGFTQTERRLSVLFLVDVSGSVGEAELRQAAGEIVGALEQFDGRISVLVSFFDTQASAPVAVESVDDVLTLAPEGYGGTDFTAAFDALDMVESCDDINAIVVLTDGWAPCPDERVARGIPVLWLLSDEDASRPSWGRVAVLD